MDPITAPIPFAWQQNFLVHWANSDKIDYLLAACPGAGKTRAALGAFNHLKTQGSVSKVVVVVPSNAVRLQWSNTALDFFGLQLDYRFETSNLQLLEGFDGIVVTYQQVVTAWQRGQGDVYRNIADHSSMVIFDEIHHAGENYSWGDCLESVFAYVYSRLLLTGTPFRTGRDRIPFVSYGDDGLTLVDYKYSYGEALSGDVLRPIEFVVLDGDVSYERNDTLVDTTISADERNTDKLRVAFDPSKDWLPDAIRQADEMLTKHRKVDPRCGALLVAKDQYHAKKCAKMIEQITGTKPVLVVSEDPDAQKRLDEFARSETRWIVAVKMVSEGVDIPRLSVGVYATLTLTQLFFIQLVGRLLRKMSAHDRITACLFIPNVSGDDGADGLVDWAKQIADIVAAVAHDRDTNARERLGPGGDEWEAPTSDFRALEASPAEHDHTIIGSNEIDGKIVQGYESALSARPELAHVTGAQAATIAQMQVHFDGPPERPIHRRHLIDQLRKQCNDETKRLVLLELGEYDRNLFGERIAKVIYELDRKVGATVDRSTPDQLELRISLIRQRAEVMR